MRGVTVDEDPLHVLIPDTQCKPGVRLDHMAWAGCYMVDHCWGRPNVTWVMIGDGYDMASLSRYDRGKRASEGRRYETDIEAGNRGIHLLTEELRLRNRQARRAGRPGWTPRLVYCMGNHEDRIVRATEDEAWLDGAIDFEKDAAVKADGWEIVPFLQPIAIDGVAYCHYFYNPMNGRPQSGMIETRLKNVGHSFSQGHQQTFMYGVRPVVGRDGRPTMVHGLVAGSFYLHDEDYLGPQGNASWRGLVVCHGVKDGRYNIMQVDMDYLCRRYEGISLERFLGHPLGRALGRPAESGIGDWSSHPMGGHQ